MSTAAAAALKIESLTWWRRDCDILDACLTVFIISIESLTWWRRDCDQASPDLTRFRLPRLNHWPDEEGIATFCKKPDRIRVSSGLNHWPDEEGIATQIARSVRSVIKPIESLTWWRRDCDAGNTINFLRLWRLNHWPDEEGIATHRLRYWLRRHRLRLNHWPDEEGIATF